MSTSDSYDKFKKHIAEAGNRLPVSPKEVSQETLYRKNYITYRIEKDFPNDEKVFTFFGKDNPDAFGFSEQFVNNIIHHAYRMGYETAWVEAKGSIDDYESKIRTIIETLEEHIDYE